MVRCFNPRCTNPYHPATGHVFAGFEDVVYCGPCARHMVTFVKGMMSRKVGKTAGFYDAAATSIREGVYPAPSPRTGASSAPNSPNNWGFVVLGLDQN